MSERLNAAGLWLLERLIMCLLPPMAALVATYERGRRGWLCFRYGHDFRELTQVGRRCSRCPVWEDYR